MVAATALAGPALSSFERIFAQEYRRTVSVAFRITRDAADAEDVAQETFARFARTNIQDDDRARAWLYKAASHIAFNVLRSRRRRIEREVRSFRLARPINETTQFALDPSIETERDFEQTLVRATLLHIGERHAQVLSLRYSGLSYREMAESLGIDAAQVGTRLARAERAFRRELERETS